MDIRNRIGYNYLGSLLSIIGFLFFFLFFLFIVLNVGDAGIGKIFSNDIALLSGAGLILLAPIVATIYFRKIQQPGTQEYINRSTIRYVMAMLMLFYGYGKMHNKFFEITYLTLDSRLADIDSFSLVWYFFGRSNVQEFMIGLMEFVPAILLLFRRTSFIAVLILLPLELNVLMVNTFNHVSGFTFPLSIYLSLSGAYLLWGWKDKIILFLKSITESPRTVLNGPLNILRWAIKLWILGVIIFIFAGNFLSGLFSKPKQHYSGRNKFKGGFELSELKVNGNIINPLAGDTMYYKSIYLEPQSRWNCILDFSTVFRPHAITVKWNRSNDSVHTYLKKVNFVTHEEVDTTTEFSGTYALSAKKDTLYINGMQYGDTINAAYCKKHLPDYDWFW